MDRTACMEDTRERKLLGVAGAFLFSLAVSALYFFLYQSGYLAALCGTVGVFCAVKGYTLLGKRESVGGVVISAVLVSLLLTLSWYVCLSYDIYQAHEEWLAAGQIDYMPSFLRCMALAPQFLSEFPQYLADLGLVLLFVCVGCVLCAMSRKKRLAAMEEEKMAQVAAQVAAREAARDDDAESEDTPLPPSEE